MARPTTSRLSGGPGFAPEERQQVGLQVNAPLNVRAAPSSAELLAQALGTTLNAVTPMALDAIKENAYKQARAGMGDVTLGKVNEETQKRSRAYAAGVTHQSTVNVYNDAQREMTRWYAEEADKTLPVDEIAAQADAKMKELLGGLETDPEAAAIIAPRYQQFLDNLTGGHVKAQVEETLKRSVETAQVDIMRDLAQGGDGRYAEHVASLTALTGDRGYAVGAVLDAYGQAALEATARGEEGAKDWLSKLPTEITDENGNKVPGPMFSQARREALDQWQAKIDKAHDEFTEGKRNAAWLETMGAYEDRIDGGEFIPLTELLPRVERGDISREDALSIYKRSAEKTFSDKVIADDKGLLLEGVNWKGLLNQESPDGKRYTRDRFVDALTDIIAGYPPEQQFAASLAWSKKTNLEYPPLKAMLSEISTADPKTVAALHDKYEQVKASGLAAMYVPDEDDAALYERITDLKAAGYSDEAIQGELKRDPKEVDAYLKAHAPKINETIADATLSTVGRNVSLSDEDVLNKAQAHRMLAMLTATGLRNNMSLDRAAEWAQERFQQSHTAIKTNRGILLLPKGSGLDAEAMEWTYQNLLPEYAQKRGLDAEDLRFTPVGPNGEMMVTDGNGMRVDDRLFSPQDINALYQERRKAEAHYALAGKVNQAQSYHGINTERDLQRFKQKQKEYADMRAKFDGMLWPVTGESLFGTPKPTQSLDAMGKEQAPAAQADVEQAVAPDLSEAQAPKGPKGEVSPATARRVMLLVDEKAQAHGVEPKLARAVAYVESSHGKKLRNPDSSARGPMHILKDTFDGINRQHFDGKLSWDNVEHQTEASVKFLKHLHDKYGDVEVAFAAYLLGEPTADAAMRRGGKSALARVKPPGNNMSTLAYVRKALSQIS